MRLSLANLPRKAHSMRHLFISFPIISLWTHDGVFVSSLEFATSARTVWARRDFLAAISRRIGINRMFPIDSYYIDRASISGSALRDFRLTLNHEFNQAIRLPPICSCGFLCAAAPLESVELSRSNKCRIGHIVQLWFAIGFVHVAGKRVTRPNARLAVRQWAMIRTKRTM